MADEKVKQLGLVRDDAYTYMIKRGEVWRQKEDEEQECVMQLGIEQDPDYRYFLDPDGDVSRRPRRAPAESATATAATPVTFAAAFAALRPHIGKKVFAELAKGRKAVTIFDWSKLGADDRSVLVESHLYELAQKAGKGWDAHLVPFALVGGESHPVPVDELDQQADGVLLLDLEAGGAIAYCNDPSTETAKTIAPNAGALVIRV
jgi:hypothetical protein